MSMIISYRPKSSDSSSFLDVDKLAKSKNCQKIKKKYEDIFHSVTAYDKEHADTLAKVENNLYQRMVFLNTKKKESLEGWKTIAFSVLTLGAWSLIAKYKLKHINKAIEEIEQSHAGFLRALAQMHERKIVKDPQPKPEALKELESLRLDDLEEELARLKAIPRVARSLEKIPEFLNRIKEKAESRIPKTISNLEEQGASPEVISMMVERIEKQCDEELAAVANFSIGHQVAYGRSLELQEKLKETHYVINHAQDLKAIVVNILTREIKKEFESKHYESFEPLRHDAFLRKIEKTTDNPSWYQSQIDGGELNWESSSTELISGDCDLDSQKDAESALFYFLMGNNVLTGNDSSLFNKFIVTILQDYISGKEATEVIAEDLAKIMNKYLSGSNLCSICIPKEKFDESCYFSKPFSFSFTPEENQHFKEIIDDLQSGKIEDLAITPQVRVLSNKIRAEDGYYVVRNSSMAEDELQKLEDEVSLYLQAALAGYRIQGEDAKQLFRGQ